MQSRAGLFPALGLTRHSPARRCTVRSGLLTIQWILGGLLMAPAAGCAVPLAGQGGQKPVPTREAPLQAGPAREPTVRQADYAEATSPAEPDAPGTNPDIQLTSVVTDNPVAKRHSDFVCIAAANTWGRGADRQYCGRNELDEATLDRFRIGCVPMDYDEGLEAQLCPDDALRGRLQVYRKVAQANRLERIVSTRFIAQAYIKKHRDGWTHKQIDDKLFNGWRDDEIRKVKG